MKVIKKARIVILRDGDFKRPTGNLKDIKTDTTEEIHLADLVVYINNKSKLKLLKSRWW